MNFYDNDYEIPISWRSSERYQAGSILKQIGYYGHAISRHVRDYAKILKEDYLSFYQSPADGKMYLFSEDVENAALFWDDDLQIVDTIFICPECRITGHISEFENSKCPECQKIYNKFNNIVKIYES